MGLSRRCLQSQEFQVIITLRWSSTASGSARESLDLHLARLLPEASWLEIDLIQNAKISTIRSTPEEVCGLLGLGWARFVQIDSQIRAGPLIPSNRLKVPDLNPFFANRVSGKFKI